MTVTTTYESLDRIEPFFTCAKCPDWRVDPRKRRSGREALEHAQTRGMFFHSGGDVAIRWVSVERLYEYTKP